MILVMGVSSLPRFSPWFEHVGALAEEHLGALHQRFRQRGMGVDRQFHVVRRGAHFDRQDPLRNQLAGAGAGDAYAEDAPGFRFQHELGQPLRAVDGDGPPDGGPGNLATSISVPRSRACASVRPHQAISGSVKTTAGMASGSKTPLCPAMASIATRASCDALCASIGSPATSPIAKIDDSAVRRCPSVSMNPFASTLTAVASRPGIFEFGRRPTATSTRSNTCSDVEPGCPLLPLEDPSNVTRIPFASSATLVTFVFTMIEANTFSSRLCRTFTRSRSAPGRSPAVISTTDTLLPSVA